LFFLVHCLARLDCLRKNARKCGDLLKNRSHHFTTPANLLNSMVMILRRHQLIHGMSVSHHNTLHGMSVSNHNTLHGMSVSQTTTQKDGHFHTFLWNVFDEDFCVLGIVFLLCRDLPCHSENCSKRKRAWERVSLVPKRKTK
jgi:hypothetical protein